MHSRGCVKSMYRFRLAELSRINQCCSPITRQRDRTETKKLVVLKRNHHEAHEGHEGFIHFILSNFVLFAILVVKCLFLLWLRLDRATLFAGKSLRADEKEKICV